MLKLLIACLLLPQVWINGQKVEDLAKSQAVRIVATSYNSKNEPSNQYGIGLVFNGEYLATCYHLIVPEDTLYKFSHVFMIHNERYEKGIFYYDSILLIRDFKPSKRQYDFSKHIYSVENPKTDFIVFKLAKKINPVKQYFANSNPSRLDTVYAFGNVKKDKTIYSKFQPGIFFFKYTKDNTDTALFFASIVKYTHGFSGSPLFNSKGQIMGMVQYSMENIPDDIFFNICKSNNVPDYDYNKMKNHFKNGLKLQFSIDINFLKEKYLKGYL